MTHSQMICLFKSIDDNNSGEVCFQEFADLLFPDLDIADTDVITPQKPLHELPPCILTDPNSQNETEFKLAALDKRVEKMEAIIGNLCAEQRRLLQRLST